MDEEGRQNNQGSSRPDASNARVARDPARVQKPRDPTNLHTPGLRASYCDCDVHRFIRGEPPKGRSNWEGA